MGNNKEWDIFITNKSNLFNLKPNQVWRHRDLRFLISFGVQLWMYATPVINPILVMRKSFPHYIWVLASNHLAAILKTFKYTFTGVGKSNWLYLAYSFSFTAVILLRSIVIFNRVQ